MADSCSIIIQSFNCGRYLAQAVDSALAQHADQVEVIVVDDGSTDDSRDVLAGYHDQVTCIFKENGGQGSSWNAGFAASQGDVVLFLDADDMLEPDAVSTVMPYFADADVVFVHWLMRTIDADGVELGEIVPNLPLAEGHLRDVMLAYGPNSVKTSPTSACASSRSLLTTILPMPEDVYRVAAEWYLDTLAPVFGRLVAVERPLTRYRRHGAQATALTARGLVDLNRGRFPEHCKAVAALLARHGIEVDLEGWDREYFFNRIQRSVTAVSRVVPAETSFVLADGLAIPRELFEDRRAVGLEALDNWKRPTNDEMVAELWRALDQFEYVVVGWMRFWWLDDDPALAERLLEDFRPVLENEDVRIYVRR